jgi:hypothetical protein
MLAAIYNCFIDGFDIFNKDAKALLDESSA